jgi:hypothetical protein
MKFAQRRTVYADLNTYCHHAKPDDTIEVCEWASGEGWDISIGTRQLMLTHGELQALTVLCNTPHPREAK